MSSSKSLKLLSVIITISVGFLVCIEAHGQATRSQRELEIVQLRANFYMIAGAGGNIAVQIGSDGVVLVDSGSDATVDQVLAAVRRITEAPIRYIINTSPAPDHVGGNAKLAQAGQTIFGNLVGNPDLANAMTNGGAAAVLAHESVLLKMSAPTGRAASFPVEGWPTEAFSERRKYLRLNQEAIEILRQPAAHSDADSFVFFRGSDVVVAGDVIDMTRFPAIDIANGGSVQGEIDALNRLIELAVPTGPFVYQGTGTYVIPGHGRACEQLDVVDYRDMVVIVRDVIADLIKQGKSLQEVIAASPAKPFETRYGSQPGATREFVEAVYRSLTPSE